MLMHFHYLFNSNTYLLISYIINALYYPFNLFYATQVYLYVGYVEINFFD